jgi:hypothetical protein
MAIYGGLAESASDSTVALTNFDFILIQSPKPRGADSAGFPVSDADRQGAAALYHQGPEADHDGADEQTLTTIHDLDT